MFNINFFGIGDQKIKVFEKLNSSIYNVLDNIKFILSYNSLEIDPQLKEHLDNFLYYTNTIDLLFHSLKETNNSANFV